MYNTFENGKTVVKPQSRRDTDIIKWSIRTDEYGSNPNNSYTLIQDEKGAWIDSTGTRVTCLSINGGGETRWVMDACSNTSGEYQIVKKFGLKWALDEDRKPYWLLKAEEEMQP